MGNSSGHEARSSVTEMIVLAGYNGSTLNSGGRYNPSTDSWLTTTTNGAPSKRYGHTTVWTGSEMVVWGGQNTSGTYISSGGRYNPSTDSWVPTSTVGAPTTGETGVWTGSEMTLASSRFRFSTVYSTVGQNLLQNCAILRNAPRKRNCELPSISRDMQRSEKLRNSLSLNYNPAALTN
jgi:hypothetical protein